MRAHGLTAEAESEPAHCFLTETPRRPNKLRKLQKLSRMCFAGMIYTSRVIYIYIFIYMSVYIYICISLNTHIYICRCMYVCMYGMYVCMYGASGEVACLRLQLHAHGQQRTMSILVQMLQSSDY